MKIVNRVLIEEQTVEAPMKERDDVLRYIHENGFATAYSGPKPIETGRVDMTTFYAVIRREIEREDA